MRLANKIAIVTGGGSGFGEGIVRKFSAEGARVVIMDVDADKAQSVAGELGKGVVAMKADVTREVDFAAAVELALEEFGGLDVLINNAGVGHTPQPMEDVDEVIFDRVMEVNTKSIYLGAKTVMPLLKKKESGVIINIASTGGVSPRPNLTWYNASKGWVITATKAMAVELAPFGIRVNAINPVAGETPLLATFMGSDTPQARAKFLATIPIGRFSNGDDIGNTATFLASDEASLITGVALNVDGGRCI